jgi:hypothetical protein
LPTRIGHPTPSADNHPNRQWRSEAPAAGRDPAAAGIGPPHPAVLGLKSRACFEHQIERSLRGAPELGEAAILDHGAQPALACLCAQAQTDFL